jgi:predicted phage tail protein
MGTGQNASKWGMIAGAVLVGVGAVLTATGVGMPLGIPLGTVGVGLMMASSIAGGLIGPEAPDIGKKKHGTHFSYDQYRNPVGEDNVVPVVYGTAVVAPIIAA